VAACRRNEATPAREKRVAVGVGALRQRLSLVTVSAATAGVVALLVGGNFVMATLIAAGLTFGVVLLIGAFYVTVRFVIALAPLAIVVAIVLYVLHRWFDVGPGLPI
jgi:hypothetical protein